MTTITYFELLNQALRLYREGRLAEAYDLVTQNGELVLGNPAQIFNFRYSIAGKLGDRGLALRLMREAIVDRGYWYGYNYLMEDDDLESLRSSPEFLSLAVTCQEREAEAKRNCRPSLKVMRSERPDANERKLLMALHGNGDSADLIDGYWLPSLRLGYSLALPQSSQTTFWDAYTWDDLERGRSELSQHISSVRSALGTGAMDMILAGFSGGARLALHSVLMGDVAPSGLMLVAPWLPELDKWADEIRSLGKKGIRVWILCGDQDRDCLEGSKKLSSMMGSTGACVHLEIVEGLEHDFPIDFEERLTRALKSFFGSKQ